MRTALNTPMSGKSFITLCRNPLTVFQVPLGGTASPETPQVGDILPSNSYTGTGRTTPPTIYIQRTRLIRVHKLEYINEEIGHYFESDITLNRTLL
jgi:hypothetical protein